jgi:hypothetical protein
VSHLAEGYSRLAALLGMPDPRAVAGGAEDAQPAAAAAAAPAPEHDPSEGEPQNSEAFDKRRARMAEALNLRRAGAAG